MTRDITSFGASASAKPSSSLSLSAAGTSSGLTHFSSSLATYANVNPYDPIPDPKPPAVESSPSNVTLAMLQSFHLKGLEAPSAFYSVKGVSVGFPGMVGGIPGVLALNIVDSLPRDEDWRSLNQFSSTDLIKKLASHELQVSILSLFENIVHSIVFMFYNNK